LDKLWPDCSLFAVYDGHGGVKAANYLRDRFHENLITCSAFPKNPRNALLYACKKSE